MMRISLLVFYTLLAGAAGVRVLQEPSILVLQGGHSAQMSCVTEDAPGATGLLYYWSFNGSTVNNNSRVTIRQHDFSSSLLIPSVTLRDSGRYLCSVRILHPTHSDHHGNGTELLVTAMPVLSVRMEAVSAGKQILVCQAERFHPQELNITWSFSLMGLQTQENLTEDEDGSYTKTSSVEITEELRGRGTNGVTCYVQHITLPETINKTLLLPQVEPKTLLHIPEQSHNYLYALLGILPLLVVGFLCLKYLCPRVWKRSGTSEPGAGGNRHMKQEKDEDTALQYATINHSVHGSGLKKKKVQRKPLMKEQSTEYAAVRVTAHTTATYGQDRMEDTGVCYATLRMSPPLAAALTQDELYYQ